MKTTILFDTDPKIQQANPENCLLIKRTSDIPSDQEDYTLYHLSSFLNSICRDDIDDVRPIVRHYSQFGADWLDKFVESQAKEAEEEERRIREEASKRASSTSYFSKYKNLKH